MWRAIRRRARGSSGRGRKWRSTATCICAERRTIRFCWDIFTCWAGKCRSGETILRSTRGDINFANPFQLDPELNIEATSTISQYQVTINFSGRASKLALSYRSDPPLPDTDIIALLAREARERKARCGRAAVAADRTTARRRCFGGNFKRPRRANRTFISGSAISAWTRSWRGRRRNRRHRRG